MEYSKSIKIKNLILPLFFIGVQHSPPVKKPFNHTLNLQKPHR